MIIAGIDPGLTGGLAFLSIDACLGFAMPVHRLVRAGRNKSELDAHAIAALLLEHRPEHVFLERAGAMPGQGTASMFAFGRAYGIVIGVLAATGMPTTFVAASVWKRALAVPAAKDGARARASQLLPAAAAEWLRAKDHGVAEAALLALYGWRQLSAIASGAAAISAPNKQGSETGDERAYQKSAGTHGRHRTGNLNLERL